MEAMYDADDERNRKKTTVTYKAKSEEKKACEGEERGRERESDRFSLAAEMWAVQSLKCAYFMSELYMYLRLALSVLRYLTASRANGWKIPVENFLLISLHSHCRHFSSSASLSPVAQHHPHIFAIMKPLWHFVFHQFELKLSTHSDALIQTHIRIHSSKCHCSSNQLLC